MYIHNARQPKPKPKRTLTNTNAHAHAHSQVAHVFVNLANLVLLSRGKNILSEDFKYYSPGTGKLDRDRFVRVLLWLAGGWRGAGGISNAAVCAYQGM